MSKKSKGVSYAKYGYIFSIPFVVAFCVFMLYPMAQTISYAFSDFQGAAKFISGEYSMLEKPFDNFRLLIFENQLFRTSLSNTIKIWIFNFIPQLLLALLLAAWFTNRRSKVRGQGLFKVLFYMPNIITAGSIAVLFRALFGFPVGPMNYFRDLLGLAPYDFLNNASISQYTVSFIQFWMWYGYTMLIVISGILGLNPEMYESSEIDGANGVQQFLYITLPNLRTIIIFVLVTSSVGGLTMFDIPYLFNNGGPGSATQTLATFIYNQAFAGSYFFNRAAAASILVFFLIGLLSIIIFMLMRDKDEARLRKEKKALQRALKAERREQNG